MKKQRLDLDRLSVESFGTTAGPADARGTVNGRATRRAGVRAPGTWTRTKATVRLPPARDER